MSPAGTLVLAWGNPGRRDDGLGPALAARLVAAEPPGVTVESGYQLQIEDAVEVARHDRVIFVDADRSTGSAPFRLERIEPATGALGYTSHEGSPAQVLALGRELFGHEPQAWLLGIRGFEFDEFGEGLSRRAAENLEAAARFLLAEIADDVRPGPFASPEPIAQERVRG